MEATAAFRASILRYATGLCALLLAVAHCMPAPGYFFNPGPLPADKNTFVGPYEDWYAGSSLSGRYYGSRLFASTSPAAAATVIMHGYVELRRQNEARPFACLDNQGLVHSHDGHDDHAGDRHHGCAVVSLVKATDNGKLALRMAGKTFTVGEYLALGPQPRGSKVAATLALTANGNIGWAAGSRSATTFHVTRRAAAAQRGGGGTASAPTFEGQRVGAAAPMPVGGIAVVLYVERKK